jgi:hypothetical protein
MSLCARSNSSMLGPRIAEYIPCVSSGSVLAIVLLMLSHEMVFAISCWTLSMCSVLLTVGLRSTMNVLGMAAPAVVGIAAAAARFVLVPKPMGPGVYVNNSTKIGVIRDVHAQSAVELVPFLGKDVDVAFLAIAVDVRGDVVFPALELEAIEVLELEAGETTEFEDWRGKVADVVGFSETHRLRYFTGLRAARRTEEVEAREEDETKEEATVWTGK